MCMAITELRFSEQQQPGRKRCCLKIRRIMTTFSCLSYARLILAMIIAIHFIQQTTTEGNTSLTTLAVVNNYASLSRSWAAVWVIMVYILLNHKCRHLREQVADITRAAATAATTSSNALTQGMATSTQALSKMRSSVSLSSMRLFGVKGGTGVDCVGRSLAISQKECFLQEHVLSDLTLKDIQHVFMYAVESNSTDFELTKFMASVRPVAPAAKSAIAALEKVLVSSRGIHVQPSQRPITSCGDFGSMDALAFAATVRLFAEWRSLRLVPDCNQRYGVGMGLARRDLVHNVAKIEQAAHAWMGFHQGVYDRSSNQLKTISPTIRQLLQHEIELRVHANLPALADKSAASGLLWAKRQIHYQTCVFENLSQIPFVFPSSKAGVNAAYEEVYGKYHGFFVRHIFQTSFEAAPDAVVILNHMNAPYLVNPRCTQVDDDDDETAGTENAANDSSDEDDEDDDWIHHPVDDHNNSGTDEDEDVVAFETPVASFIPTKQTMLRSSLGDQWCKFLDFWLQCAGEQQQQQHKHPRTAFASSPALRLSSISIQNDEWASSGGGAVVGGKCSSRSTNGDVADIHGYLQVMQPMIKGLNNLISELNMNDPTKV